MRADERTRPRTPYGGMVMRLWRSAVRSIGILALILIAGCASSRAMRGSPSQPALAEGVDASRAMVPLDRLEPAIAPTVSNPPAALSERAARQVALARELMDQQRFTDAAIELERALRYDANHPYVHRALAELHWRAGNLGRAKTHAQQALSANADDAVSQFIVGRCLAEEGDRPGAILAYRTAFHCSDFGRDHAFALETYLKLGEALAAEDYLVAALECLRSVDQASAEGDGSRLAAVERAARLSRVAILERLGRVGEAAGELRPIATGTADVETHLRLARLYLAAGESDESIAALADLDVDDEAILGTLIEAYRRSGRLDGAVDALRDRSRQGRLGPRGVLQMADLLHELGRRDAAEELTRYLEFRPDALPVRLRLVSEYASAGEWNAALRAAAEGFARAPEQEEELRAALTAIGDDADAVAALEAAPTDGETASHAFALGLVMERGGRPQAAEARYRSSLAADSGVVPARAALARLLSRQHRYDEAIAAAQRRDPNVVDDARLEMVLGEVFDRLDDIKQAELHYRAALDKDRTNVLAQMELAALARRSGDILTAQQVLRGLLRQNPDHEATREALSFAYLERGELEAALHELDELRQRSTRPTTVARCAALLEQVNKPDAEQYRKRLLAAMSEHGEDVETWLAVAESYVEFEEDAARHAYERVLRLSPDHESALVGLKDVHRRQLDFDGACEYLRRLLTSRPNRHTWRLELIELRLALADSDSALEVVRGQLGRSDLDERARRAYQQSLLSAMTQAGQSEELEQTLRGLVQQEEHGASWALQLAAWYDDRDRPQDAIAVLEARAAKGTPDPVLLRALVELLARTGQETRAYQMLLDRLWEDPQQDEVAAMLISTLAEAKRVDDAVELVRNRLVRTPQREAYQDLWIGVLARNDRDASAATITEGMLDQVGAALARFQDPQGRAPATNDLDSLLFRPDDTSRVERLHARMDSLRQRLVVLLMGADRNRDAERMLTQWLERARDGRSQLGFLRLLAVLQQRLGADDLAQEATEQAFRLSPDDTTLSNDVAYGWINRGIRLPEAERLIRVALSRDPRSAAYLDTYGWLLYKSGRFDESARWLERATRNATEPDGVICDHLGDALWQAGHFEEAVAQWKRAVALVRSKPARDWFSSDEHRVLETTSTKADNGAAGRVPPVAAVASPDAAESAKGDAGAASGSK